MSHPISNAEHERLMGDNERLTAEVQELRAALEHIDACCYGSEMLDWTSQLNVTKNLVNIHLEASASLGSRAGEEQ